MAALLAAGDEIAQLLWTRGLTLEDVGKADAEALKKSLEAETAKVTILDDSPQALQFVVAGQAHRSDQTSFAEPGHSVRAFDAVSETEVAPLGRPANLSAQGSYRIVYSWQSSQGRNGPNLLVRLFAPDETVIAEAGKQFAHAS